MDKRSEETVHQRVHEDADKYIKSCSCPTTFAFGENQIKQQCVIAEHRREYVILI